MKEASNRFTDWVMPILSEIKLRLTKLIEKENGPSNCMGYCAITSFAVVAALQEKGIDAQLVHGCFYEYTHCWVETDYYFIDLTAAQFGSYPDILILRKTDVSPGMFKGMYARHFWLDYENEEWKKWPSTQKPSKRRTEFLLKNLVC